MKTSLRLAAFIALLGFLALPLRAQVPQFINYQGLISVGATASSCGCSTQRLWTRSVRSATRRKRRCI